MEKKTDNKNKIIIALAILTIVILLVGIWAFARYTSTITGSGTLSVAAWSFKVNGQSQNLTENIDLLGTMSSVNGKVAPKHIAPGTNGSFDVSIDATGSEVAVEYSVVLSNFTNLPRNLHFYTDSAMKNEVTASDGSFTISGYIPYDTTKNAMKKTVTVYWAWPYQTGTTDEEKAANDIQDTQDSGKDVACDIAVTGWQSNPTVAE